MCFRVFCQSSFLCAVILQSRTAEQVECFLIGRWILLDFPWRRCGPRKIEFPSRLAPFHWRRWDFKQIKYQKRFNSIEFHVSYSKDILRWNLSALDVRHRLISRFLYFVSSKRSFFFRVWKLFFYANAMNRNPIGHFEKNFLQILRDCDGFSSSFFCPSLPSTSSEEKAACGWWKNLSCI